LIQLCVPRAMRLQRGAAAWFARQLADLSPHSSLSHLDEQ
jgi:hypothetical protein